MLPLDFLLWRTVKDSVYQNILTIPDDMQQRIRQIPGTDHKVSQYDFRRNLNYITEHTCTTNLHVKETSTSPTGSARRQGPKSGRNVRVPNEDGLLDFGQYKVDNLTWNDGSDLGYNTRYALTEYKEIFSHLT
ncbi:hypothetical protein ANN_21700 [Periplaneta americana]|uniref:Uncharacterized protein n=1 Tax=Periplaneta americana TaxID=6978 RepID=A0ABQ8S6S7_PERAM|nr:hypothetical protein ANN_21700 [Periplaneta americana]